jgi:hypothetical protein
MCLIKKQEGIIAEQCCMQWLRSRRDTIAAEKEARPQLIKSG